MNPPTNENSPAQRTALIFGATGGIGASLARRLAAAGWTLMLSGRRAEVLEGLGREIGAASHPADATDERAVEEVFERAQALTGRVDGVVNCCGSLLLKPGHLTTLDEWSATLAANLTTSFLILRSAAARMLRTGGGSIVLVSSAVARRGMINHEAVAAAKAGVAGLAQAAAATHARHGIRVNAVAPGLVRTPLAAALTRHEASLKASAALHPMGRIGEPHEVASAIAWLLDAEQAWVTGQILGVDGGLSSIQARPQAA